jgi:ribbon-helix-helix CopG family protein
VVPRYIDSVARDARERDGRTDKEPVHQMLVRLPVSQERRLRKRAYEEERPKAEILRDALDQYLDRVGA